MPSYRITNRSSAPVLLRLRSGPTLHLAPGERTGSLHSAEVMRNPRIASLRERRLVDVDEVDDAAERGGGRRSSRRRRSGKADAAATQPETEGSDEAAES